MTQENKLAIYFIMGFLFVLVATFASAYFLSVKSCENRSISFEDSKYETIGGCMVKHEGRWLPLGNIRGFE